MRGTARPCSSTGVGSLLGSIVTTTAAFAVPFSAATTTGPGTTGSKGADTTGTSSTPPSRIDNVRVVRHDSLASNLYRQTFNVNPPPDLFNYVRPATDQEWIKE